MKHTTEIKQRRLAAEQGDTEAQFALGVGCGDGEGVPQDYVQAHKWINLAALRTITGKLAEGSRSARAKLAEQMTVSQVAESQRLARKWQPKTWEQSKGE